MTCVHRCQFCDSDYACDTIQEVSEAVYRCSCKQVDTCPGCSDHGAICANPACGKGFEKNTAKQRFCCRRCVGAVTSKFAHAANSRPLRERFMEKFDKLESGCWEWRTRAGTNNYGSIGFDGTRQEHAHRVSWLLHRGPIPDGQFVLHRCDNKPCVNPDHLFLGSPADNVIDMVRKRRQRTVLDIESARQIAASTENGRVVAARFGVSPTLVYNIRAGKAWAHALSGGSRG